MARESISLEEFVYRVERFCDFFLEQIPEGDIQGSSDIKIIQDLKSDCADIQAGVLPVSSINMREASFVGLYDHMRGT